MEYRPLGRTGLQVSLLGLGTGGMNRLGQKAGLSTKESIAVVRRALDLGVNFFDSAPSYMDSEALLGQALDGVPRDSYVLATKFHPVHGSELTAPEDIRRSLERSLRRLRTDHLDALLIHSIEPPRYERIMERFVPPLQALKDAGLVRCIGMSDSFERDVTKEAARRALKANVFDVVMVGFNMLSPVAVRDVLPLAAERQVGVIAMCVIRSVISNPEVLRNIISRWKAEGVLPHDALPEDAPLDWLLDDGVESLTDAAYKFAAVQPGVSTVLSGSANLDHLAANVRAVTGPPLASETVRRLLDTFLPVGRSASHPAFLGLRG
jgi:L-galactose dehydrogenase